VLLDSKKDDKRILIIKKAIEEFSKYGYDNTDVDNIAKKADVGKGTIYRYFGSKDNLFLEVFIYIIRMMTSDLKKIMDSDMNFKEKLDRMLEQSIIWLKESDKLIKLYTFDVARLHRIMEKNKELPMQNKFSRYKILKSFLEKGQSEGLIVSEISADALTSMIIGSMQHSVMLYYGGYIKSFKNLEKRIRELIEYYKKILLKEVK
jgi:AcrR family transcriptional regulator